MSSTKAARLAKVNLKNEILRCATIDGLSVPAIADTLGISETVVRSALDEAQRQADLLHTDLVNRYKVLNLSRLNSLYEAVEPYALGEVEALGGVPSPQHTKLALDIIKQIDAMLPKLTTKEDSDVKKMTITISSSDDIYKAASMHLDPGLLVYALKDNYTVDSAYMPEINTPTVVPDPSVFGGDFERLNNLVESDADATSS
jgi:hypothetical protein